MKSLLFSLVLIMTTFSAVPAAAAESWSAEEGPLDARFSIPAEEFAPAGENTWETAWVSAPFPYDEMIYSWEVSLPEGEGFRLFVRSGGTDGGETPWVYAGYWGEVDLVEDRALPKFEGGRMAYDHLFLDETDTRLQFKVVSEGAKALTELPAIHVVATNNEPNDSLRERFGTRRDPQTMIERVLDLPLRPQRDSAGQPMADRCQSAAVATAMQYFGKQVPLEQIVAMTNDPEYDLAGIWPRTLGAASQLGFRAYIDRLRNWEDVARTLEEGKIILISMALPRGTDVIAPPYENIGGHIIALNGITRDGRAIVTDSALSDGAMVQWLKEDLEKAWFDRHGVAMIVTPPEEFEGKEVAEIPEFSRAIPQSKISKGSDGQQIWPRHPAPVVSEVSFDAARRVSDRALKLAKEKEMPVLIVVMDSQGTPITMMRMDGVDGMGAEQLLGPEATEQRVALTNANGDELGHLLVKGGDAGAAREIALEAANRF